MQDKIELENVSHWYSAIPVLRKVSLSIQKGEIVLVGGRSGSGKSTFLEICAGLITPGTGKVFWDRVLLNSFSRKEILKVRMQMGYVFQINALISNHSVYDNIALPLRNRGGMSEKEVRKKVNIQMEELGLFNVDKLFPEALSLGQIKAVALARALIIEPELLIIDELFSGLDTQVKNGMINVLNEHRKRRSITIIMTGHDMNVWNTAPVRTMILDSGKLLVCENDLCQSK